MNNPAATATIHCLTSSSSETAKPTYSPITAMRDTTTFRNIARPNDNPLASKIAKSPAK